MRILPFGEGSTYEAMRLHAEFENHARSAAAVLPPSNNMGGPNIPPPTPSEVSKTRLDWLALTTSADWQVLKIGIQCLFPNVAFATQSHGMFGYPQTTALTVDEIPIGIIGHGAKHGKNLLSITGKGCSLWSNDFYSHVQDVVEFLEAKITRIDIAMDFFAGEVTYDDTLAAYDAEEFKLPKATRAPMLGLISTSAGKVNLGRTINVGSRKGSKMARCYEKGLEVFSRMSETFRESCTDPAKLVMGEIEKAPAGTIADQWFRVEIEFKAVDYELTSDMITNRDSYFSGAYPFCARILELGDGVRPKKLKKDRDIDLEKLVQSARIGYGDLVHTLSQIGYTDTDIKNALSTGKHNQRLIKSGILQRIKTEDQDYSIPF